MFRLATFTTGPVLLGVVITLMFVLLLFVIVLIVNSNKKHSPLSLMVGVITAGMLLFTNITFCGLVSTSNKLTEIEMSPEYRMAQQRSELLAGINPVLSDIASLFLETSLISPAMIEYQKQEIRSSLWILGIVSVFIYIIGGFLMSVTMGNRRRSGVSNGMHGNYAGYDAYDSSSSEWGF